jgi:serine/threonine protein kinase SCH9
MTNDLTPLGGAQPMSPSGVTSFASALPTTSLSLHAPEFSMKPPPAKRPNHPAPNTNGSTNAVSALTSTAPSPATTNGATARTTAPGTSPPSNGTSRQPKGQIHVKLIAARGLNVQSAHARPYVVVEFEQNEFVSRDPIGEAEKEIRGAPTPAAALSRAGSSTALSALGAINSKALAIDAARGAERQRKRSNEKNTIGSNASSASSGKSGLASLMAAATNGARGASAAAAIPSPTNGHFGTLFGGPPVHNPVWKHEVTL